VVRSEIEAEFRLADLAAMRPADLLAEAKAGGLSVFADGDRLVVRGPRSAEQDLVQTLLGRKAELMPLLASDGGRVEERAVILEFDAGLTCDEAERRAHEQEAAPRGGRAP
jgi:hypothetical protein